MREVGMSCQSFIFRKLAGMVLLVGMLGVFTGCLGGKSHAPTNFLLNSVPGELDPQGSLDKQWAPASGVRVGVGPVRLPEYLNRPQIVSRTSGNEVGVQEFYRWAEPLKDGLPRVLAENISQLLNSTQVAVFPWSRSFQLDVQVAVEVLRFDGIPGGEVTLDALWTLLDGHRNVLQESRRASLTVVSRGEDYESLVDAHNRLLFLLGREIALAIRSHAASLK